MEEIQEKAFVAYVWTELLLKLAITPVKDFVMRQAFWTGAVLFFSLLFLGCDPKTGLVLAIMAGIIRSIPLSIRLINLFVVAVFFLAVASQGSPKLLELALTSHSANANN